MQTRQDKVYALYYMYDNALSLIAIHGVSVFAYKFARGLMQDKTSPVGTVLDATNPRDRLTCIQIAVFYFTYSLGWRMCVRVPSHTE